MGLKKIRRSRYYKDVYKWFYESLSMVPFLMFESNPNYSIGDHLQTLLPVVSSAVDGEDFEAAQAMKDCIKDFLNSKGANITDEDVLKLPPVCTEKIQGIICLGRRDDISGMASGGAVWL